MTDKNFCPDHKCLKDKVDNLGIEKKFWHRILDSKWFFWAVTGMIAGCLLFGAWTVREIYGQKANEKENKKVIEIFYKETQEIKLDIKEIKQEISEESQKRTEQREKDQEKLMNLLIDIKKQTKK